MFINAGVTHPLPLWLKRIKNGGCLVFPLTVASENNAGSGVMARVTRDHDPWWTATILSAVGIYNCTSVRDPLLEARLSQALISQAYYEMEVSSDGRT